MAELAAAGMPTAQIARSLFLSRKTIEWHLSNAFRKLGVRHRSQLPGAIVRADDALEIPGCRS